MNTCKNPDKIYVAADSELGFKNTKTAIAYSFEQKFDTVEYIRKDALLGWAKEKNKRIDTEEGDYSLGYVSAMIDLIEKIESL